MIKSPGHPSTYGYLAEEQKMPAFGGQLTESDVSAVIRYLQGDYPPARP
jgi:mono/diheme cytochrome c family protein